MAAYKNDNKYCRTCLGKCRESFWKWLNNSDHAGVGCSILLLSVMAYCFIWLFFG